MSAIAAGAGISALFNGLNKLVGSIKDFGKEAIQTYAHFEQLQNGLSGLTGSAEKGKKMFEDLRKFSLETTFGVDTLAQASSTLMQTGTSADKLKTRLKQLGDIAGGDTQKFLRLSEVYGKIQNSGKMGGQLKDSILLMGIPIEQQLKKMGVTGTATAEQVTKAFEQMTEAGGMFYNNMDSINNTIEGKEGFVTDTMKEVMASFAEASGIADAYKAVLDPIYEVLQSIVNWLQELNKSPTLKSLLSGAIVAVLTSLVAIIGGTLIVALGAIIKKLGIIAALKAAINPKAAIAGIAAGLAMGAFVYAMSSAHNEIKKTGAEIDNLTHGINNMRGAIAQLGSLKIAADAVEEETKNLENAKNALKTIQDNIDNSRSSSERNRIETAKSTVESTKNTISALEKSIASDDAVALSLAIQLDIDEDKFRKDYFKLKKELEKATRTGIGFTEAQANVDKAFSMFPSEQTADANNYKKALDNIYVQTNQLEEKKYGLQRLETNLGNLQNFNANTAYQNGLREIENAERKLELAQKLYKEEQDYNSLLTKATSIKNSTSSEEEKVKQLVAQIAELKQGYNLKKTDKNGHQKNIVDMENDEAKLFKTTLDEAIAKLNKELAEHRKKMKLDQLPDWFKLVQKTAGLTDKDVEGLSGNNGKALIDKIKEIQTQFNNNNDFNNFSNKNNQILSNLETWSKIVQTMQTDTTIRGEDRFKESDNSYKSAITELNNALDTTVRELFTEFVDIGEVDGEEDEIRLKNVIDQMNSAYESAIKSGINPTTEAMQTLKVSSELASKALEQYSKEVATMKELTDKNIDLNNYLSQFKEEDGDYKISAIDPRKYEAHKEGISSENYEQFDALRIENALLEAIASADIKGVMDVTFLRSVKNISTSMDSIKEKMNNASNGFDKAFEGIKGSLEVAGEIFKSIGVSFASSLMEASGDMQNFIQGLTNTGSIWGAIISTIVGALMNVCKGIDGFDEALNPVTTLFQNLSEVIYVIMSIITMLVKVIKAIAAIINSILKILRPILNIIIQLCEWIGKFADWIVEICDKLMKFLGIQDRTNDAKEDEAKRLEELKNEYASLLDAMKEQEDYYLKKKQEINSEIYSNSINSGSMKSTKVNDMILSPNGRFSTSPEDFIIATKNPYALASSLSPSGNTELKMSVKIENTISDVAQVQTSTKKDEEGNEQLVVSIISRIANDIALGDEGMDSAFDYRESRLQGRYI